MQASHGSFATARFLMLCHPIGRWLEATGERTLSRTTIREQAGPTWGNGRVDKFKQTIQRRKALQNAQTVNAAAAAGMAAATAAMAGSPMPPPVGLAASPADIVRGLG